LDGKFSNVKLITTIIHDTKLVLDFLEEYKNSFACCNTLFLINDKRENTSEHMQEIDVTSPTNPIQTWIIYQLHKHSSGIYVNHVNNISKIS